jgi:hypothetical protein
MRRLIALTAVLPLLVGCHDDPVAPRDVTPPAAPRSLYSVTDDGQVRLYWVANTEADLAGYRIYSSSCARGPSCPYGFLQAAPNSATSATISLANGVTRYFAITAVDFAGNESLLSGDVSLEDVYDTPRPAGINAQLGDWNVEPSISAWDFSAHDTPGAVVPWDSPNADMVFGFSSGTPFLYAAYTDVEIQDAGYSSTLDAVDFAPPAGWSADGIVEAIPGHNYILKIGDTSFANYAKIRVTGFLTVPGGAPRVRFDWAYQEVPNNGELRAGRPRDGAARVRRPIPAPTP